MSRIRDYSLALIAILLLSSGTGYGRETTCIDPPLPLTKAELLRPHKAVFSGKVVKIMLAHVHDVITFEVTRSWKGMDAHTAEMWRAVAAYKGVTFEVGETYLVFATGEDGDHQIFRIESCSRSKKLVEAGPEMALLGEKPPRSSPIRLPSGFQLPDQSGSEQSSPDDSDISDFRPSGPPPIP